MSGVPGTTTGIAERQAADGAARLAVLSGRARTSRSEDGPTSLVELWAALRPLLTPRLPDQAVDPASAPPWFSSPGWGGCEHGREIRRTERPSGWRSVDLSWLPSVSRRGWEHGLRVGRGGSGK